jgi:hypothetical protein
MFTLLTTDEGRRAGVRGRLTLRATVGAALEIMHRAIIAAA